MKTEQEVRKLIELKGENFINIDWDEISSDYNLPKDFIKKFQDKVNWLYISRFQTLSEDFIREFKDKVDWKYIPYYQKLSEEFKEEFKDKIYLGFNSKYQKSSGNCMYISEYNARLKELEELGEL